jgi:hypothetical protein
MPQEGRPPPASGVKGRCEAPLTLRFSLGFAPLLTPCAAGGVRLIMGLVPVVTVTRPWESGISWRVSLETRPDHQ